MGTLLLKDEGVARAHLVHRLDQLSGEEWTPRMRGARGPRTYIRSTITAHSSRLVFASSSPSLSDGHRDEHQQATARIASAKTQIWCNSQLICKPSRVIAAAAVGRWPAGRLKSPPFPAFLCGSSRRITTTRTHRFQGEGTGSFPFRMHFV
jgi:hypothetical protein